MSTYIQAMTGEGWYSSASIEEVRQHLENGDILDVWWFSPWGQRFREQLAIEPENVAFLRTESDD